MSIVILCIIAMLLYFALYLIEKTGPEALAVKKGV